MINVGIMSKKNESNEEYCKLKLGFTNVLTSLSSLKSHITVLNNQVKMLEKSVNKKLKVLEKEANKNKNKGNRKPTGFASSGPVSSSLCKFMNVDDGTEFARTEVTRYLIKYIKEKKLQDTENKKIIKPDAALKSLLKPKKHEEVTYFNLQRHMNKHFVKKKVQ